MPKNKTVEKLMGAIKSADEAAAGEDAAALKLTQDAHDNDDDAVATPDAPVAPEPEVANPPAAAAPVTPSEVPSAPEPAAASSDSRPEAERRITSERDRLRAALAAAQERLRQQETTRVAAPAPVKEAPKPADPEPKFDEMFPGKSMQEYPVEAQEFREAQRDWKIREQERRIIAAEERAARIEAMTEQNTQIQQFDAGVATIRNEYEAANPALAGAREFLRNAQTNILRRQGIPEHELGSRVNNMEREVLVTQANHARQMVEQGVLDPNTNVIHYALDYLQGMAQDYGYVHKQAEAPANTPRGNVAQIKDQAARASAARSVNAMSHSPATLPAEGEKMTLEKLAEMTSLQRTAYKKAHPDWEASIFGKDDGNFITAR